MSMIGNVVALSPERLDALLADPDQVEAFLYPEEGESGPENHLELDKSWHAIHFTLNGQPWEGEGALGNVILGGQEFGEDVGYGPARYLTPVEVAEVAEALRALPTEAFATRFDPAALAAADIYPEIWNEDRSELLDYVLSFYGDLRAFYDEAAGKRHAVLLYLN